MIILDNTHAGAVTAAIEAERRRKGSPAVSMVLTLIIVTDELHQADALAAASQAAREHPMRIIGLILRPGREEAHLDVQIQVGGDDGPGELIACRLHGPLAKHAGSVAIPLLLPDTPVVAWWPGDAPDKPAADPIGKHAQRRITDTNSSSSYVEELGIRLANYEPGDTDLAWTRTTPWRSMLAAALDQPVGRVTRATVYVQSRVPSGLLIAGWLQRRLRVPTEVIHSRGPGITKIVLTTTKGEVILSRPAGRSAQLEMPDAPVSKVVLPRRTLAEQLAEELRRLDPDEIYLQALRGVDRITHEAHSLPGIDLKRTAKKVTTEAKSAPVKRVAAKKSAQADEAAPIKRAGVKKTAAAKKSVAKKVPAKPLAKKVVPKPVAKKAAVKRVAKKASAATTVQTSAQKKAVKKVAKPSPRLVSVKKAAAPRLAPRRAK
jgi:glucose-6-phosphate dehydrogenase assembly protein OpcA